MKSDFSFTTHNGTTFSLISHDKVCVIRPEQPESILPIVDLFDAVSKINAFIAPHAPNFAVPNARRVRRASARPNHAIVRHSIN